MRLLILILILAGLLGFYFWIMSGPYPNAKQFETSKKAIIAFNIPTNAEKIEISHKWGVAFKGCCDGASWMRHAYFQLRYEIKGKTHTKNVHVAIAAEK
jgi:hypothetical protein